MLKKTPKLAVFLRLLLIDIMLLAVFPAMEPLATALATPSQPTAAPAKAPAAASTAALKLKVVSARKEEKWTGDNAHDLIGHNPAVTGISLGDQVANYKYLINLDNVGDPAQARTDGCSPTANADYPKNCNWPSIRAIDGASPVITQGTQDDLNDTISLNGLPNGKYLISVMADNFKIDGLHFTIPLAAPGLVTVGLQPFPLPLATIQIQVFNDNYSTNGQFDVPGENGISGFQGHIFDVLAEVTTDWFGNPLCTVYETDASGAVVFGADGKPKITTVGGKCLSHANGVITIPNLGPNRYTAQVTPAPGWVQTTTLEGNHDYDVWVQEGALGYDTEFSGPNAEPVPAIPFGFVQSNTNSMKAGATGHIKGVVDGSKSYIPQTKGLPLNSQDFSAGYGTKIDKPIKKPWIALSDLRNGDQTVYVGRGNADGTFDIPNVPNSDYSIAIWDDAQNFILELRQATVANGSVTDLGVVLLAGWWTNFDGYVFIDLNGNGKRDPGEPGVANQTVLMKTRSNNVMDRGSTSATTDANGHYSFPNGYPITSWLVMEVYNDRFQTTGVTFQADNQPAPTTVLGSGVDVSVHPVIGLSGTLDWGVKPYTRGTNGGIVGTVTYDTTRNELDPRDAVTEDYQTGIPDLTVDLYAPVPDGNGGYLKDADGAYTKGPLLNQYTTETWQRPTGCTARDINGDQVIQQVLPLDNSKDCLEMPMMGVQFQTGFSTVNGNYGFSTMQQYDASGNPVAGTEVPLPPGDYLVKVEIPNDNILHKPLYKVTTEEDVNVFSGDKFVPQSINPPCVGALHTINITNPDFLAAYPPDPNVPGSIGGGPYNGQSRPYCDVKLVTVKDSRSIAPNFNLFTPVPIPGRFSGLIVDDLNVSSNPKESLFGEKRGVPNAPIGVYDFNNRLIMTVQSDPNGLFEVLLPSTSTYNCPLPAGPCPNVYHLVGNDPGIPGQLNANYNPQYRTIAAEFEIWPGEVLPADLAPTTISTAIAIPGGQSNTFPQCALANDTPQFFAISKPYMTTAATGVTRNITINGQGFGSNTSGGRIWLGNRVLRVVSWTDSQIVATVPEMDAGTYQLKITANNGQKTAINSLTFHILGAGYNPPVFEVGPGKPYATIQAAVEAASGKNGLVVVYPGTQTQGNPKGVYYENLIMHSAIKLQGVGPGGIQANGSHVPGAVIDGLGFEQVNVAPWTALLNTLRWSGNQQVFEGAVISVFAQEGTFTNGFKAAIDGLTIQGGDQLSFPNKTNSLLEGGVGLTQGGGIFVNGYAHYLQITNNVLQSNGGAYGGAIRLGTAYVGNNHNDNIRIGQNRIIANGGTNLAGGIGLFTGSNAYEIDHNDICGNYSAEYGGGISHFGLSPNGKIHDNRIFFNSSYDEGGGIMIAGELPTNPNALSAGAGAVNIYNNQIQDNLANDDGGGIRFLMAGTAAINVYNNFVVNNVSTHEGGGLALDDTTNARIYNNTIMKNITTATAATSNGQPAPAGLSTAGNSAALQATLGRNKPVFSNPVLLNNIFWDNRAGSWNGQTLVGIGLAGDPGSVNYWDMGVGDNTGSLTPISSVLQTPTQPSPTVTIDNTNIHDQDPKILDNNYNSSVMVFPWRGDPRFVGASLVAVDLPPNLLGNYHIQSSSPAFNTGSAKTPAGFTPVVNAPRFDIDNQARPSNLLDNTSLSGYDIGADEIPGVSLLDNFNSANTANGLASGQWSGQPQNFQISSQQLQAIKPVATSPWGGYIYWGDNAFGANQEARVLLTRNNSNAQAEQALLLKLDGLDPAGLIGPTAHGIKVKYAVSNANGAPAYTVTVQTLSPGGSWVTQKVFIGPTNTSLTNFATVTLRAQAQADGTVYVYYGTGNNPPQIGSINVVTDPTLTSPWSADYAVAGGYIGLSANSPATTTTANQSRFDNFIGGTTGL